MKTATRKHGTEKTKGIGTAKTNQIEGTVTITTAIIVTTGMMDLGRMTLRGTVLLTLKDGGDIIERMKMNMVIGKEMLSISTALNIVRTGRGIMTGIAAWSCRYIFLLVYDLTV